MRDHRPLPLINGRKRFVLFTNAKCGGTLLKRWFLGTLNLEDTFSGPRTAISNFGLRFVLSWYSRHFKFFTGTHIVNNDEYLRRFIHRYRQSTRHLLPDILHTPDWFKIAVVRNPYDRLVSAFVDKFCGKDLSKGWVQSVVMDIDTRDAAGNPEISFAQFVEYLARQDIDRVNPHWRRQSYILEGVTLDRIVDLEQVNTELPEIATHIGLPIRIDLLSRRNTTNYDGREYHGSSFVGDVSNKNLAKFHRETGGFPTKAAFYSDTLRSKVLKIYRADFELYPYLKEV